MYSTDAEDGTEQDQMDDEGTATETEAIQDAAIQSALEDTRYTPLSVNEIPYIKIEITVMSIPKLIEPDQIKLGVHGLIIHREEGSGLLLPNVPLEYGWDVETFLAGTCLKGKLPIDTWEDQSGIYAFEVQIFKES